MRFDNLPDMIDALRLRAEAGDEIRPDDDNVKRTIGFRVGKDRLYINLTSIRESREDWPEGLELLFGKHRPVVAVCINHGHGFTMDDIRGCDLCQVAMIMNS